jgi:predicted nucleic acid-binding protein
VDAFDSDVLIYAAAPDHPFGRRVRAVLPGQAPAGVGSVLLVPELLTKPVRDGADDEQVALAAILARLDLRPVDRFTAQVAVALAARHGLRTADAVHLATAVVASADRFVTNNRRDFTKQISEIQVVYPDEL